MKNTEIFSALFFFFVGDNEGITFEDKGNNGVTLEQHDKNITTPSSLNNEVVSLNKKKFFIWIVGTIVISTLTVNLLAYFGIEPPFVKETLIPLEQIILNIIKTKKNEICIDEINKLLEKKK